MNTQRNGFDERLVAEIPHLRRYARALTRGHSPTDADDLVQTCLEKALSHAPKWDEDINLRARLFAIMHNQFVSSLRRASTRRNVPLDPDAADDRHPHQDSHMELRALAHALDELPPEQREAVVLVGLEGMTYEEVAQIMQVAVGTVRSRLSRGREALRHAVGRPASLSKSRARLKHARAAARGTTLASTAS